MKCPRCTTAELEGIDYEGVAIDTCPSCQGEWLDKGELQSIIEAREVVFTKEEIEKVEGVKQSITMLMQQPENPLICPHCNVGMRQLNYAYSTGVIIDRCPQCEGVWLDKDELEHIQMIMEECERTLPELEQKMAPLLDEIKATQQAKEKKAMGQALGRGVASPVMRKLYKFLVMNS